MRNPAGSGGILRRSPRLRCSAPSSRHPDSLPSHPQSCPEGNNPARSVWANWAGRRGHGARRASRVPASPAQRPGGRARASDRGDAAREPGPAPESPRRPQAGSGCLPFLGHRLVHRPRCRGRDPGVLWGPHCNRTGSACSHHHGLPGKAPSVTRWGRGWGDAAAPCGSTGACLAAGAGCRGRWAPRASRRRLGEAVSKITHRAARSHPSTEVGGTGTGGKGAKYIHTSLPSSPSDARFWGDPLPRPLTLLPRRFAA